MLHVCGTLVASVVLVSTSVLEPIAFQSFGNEVVLMHDEYLLDKLLIYFV